MLLMYKQLLKQFRSGKVFIILLLLLTTLTSLSFFFAMFSIDGNKAVLDEMEVLSETGQLFMTALESNTFLAYMFLLSASGLTVFVFVMFFYRFCRANKRQIGCLKALGFKDRSLRSCFVLYTAVISITGAILGMIGGYFLSEVLLNAYRKSYQITELVKQAGPLSLGAGLGASTILFCITAFFCYSFVQGKEPGVLIAGAGNHQAHYSPTLRIANKISGLIPVKDKFPFRIALRKPLAVFLLFVAVMSFSVCMILARSLYFSSEKVFESQTAGHNYEYDIKYMEYQTNSVPESTIPYLESQMELIVGRYHIEAQTIVGLYRLDDVYELHSDTGGMLSIPELGTVTIGPGLSDTYGVNIGDTLTVLIGSEEYFFTVSDIAANAKKTCIYVNAEELSGILDVAFGTYNGVLSMERISGDKVVTKAERVEELERDAVSNNISGVINQSLGGIVGIIMIFLALYVNFQDNTRDMLILHMMGYRPKYIRKLLINVYMPIVWVAFILTLVPSILIASSIQKFFSISTMDYMPFGTSLSVIVMVFLLLNLLYWLVQSLFGFGIKRRIAKEEMSEFVYAE